MQPTAEQISATRQAISAYVNSIDANPDRRQGAYPYCQFHDPGQAVKGTVLIFHGFSARPDQMWRLADYLFSNGFNVYPTTLAGHALIPADRHWPQIEMKREYRDPLIAKVQTDPVLSNFIANSQAGHAVVTSPTQMMGVVTRVLRIYPEAMDMAMAIERYDDPNFERYYTSTHQNYLIDAQARLAELDALPGPIYAVGLSVGGAVALALAASRPDRIEKVVAYAPLLKVYGEGRDRYINLTGPLELREMGWNQTPFPTSCFTAANRLGEDICRQNSAQILRNTPVFMVLTENEDAADIKTNKQFFQDLGGEAAGHCYYLYPKTELVPHPMVDPTEISQGMSNRFWQSLYQETYRFLDSGEIDPSNMGNLGQDPTLPQVSPVR